jgi:hypothetical protein
MTDHEKDMVLAAVKHYMKPDLRARVMREVPDAYNAWVGRDVVDVVSVNGGNSVRRVP